MVIVISVVKIKPKFLFFKNYYDYFFNILSCPPTHVCVYPLVLKMLSTFRFMDFIRWLKVSFAVPILDLKS